MHSTNIESVPTICQRLQQVAGLQKSIRQVPSDRSQSGGNTDRGSALPQHHNPCACDTTAAQPAGQRTIQRGDQLNLVVFQAEKCKVIPGKTVKANWHKRAQCIQGKAYNSMWLEHWVHVRET